MTVSQIENIAY